MYVTVHIHTVLETGLKLEDEWCVTKKINFLAEPQVQDTIWLEEFKGWIDSGKARGPKVEVRVLEPFNEVSIYLNLRDHIFNRMAFRTWLIDQGWSPCKSSEAEA